MKKLINDPENVVREELSGIARAHGDLVEVHIDPHYIVRTDAPVQGKVALVSGGGSGHEPMHGGFVGMGMLDAACPGEVFTSPTPDQMEAATKAVDGGAGVVHIVKNYTGDVMNFEMAAELVRSEGTEVEMEVGIGIRGEPGRKRLKVAPVHGVVEMMATPIVEDLPFKSGDQVLAFVNGMGGTPLIELYIVFNELASFLDGRGIGIGRNLIGPYITSLEMQGCSITLLKLDDELTDLWDAPVNTPGLRWGV